MEYRFKYQIVDEDDNVAVSGSTYITPERINTYGECESVDCEVAHGMRCFRTYLKALDIKMAEDEEDEVPNEKLV